MFKKIFLLLTIFSLFFPQVALAQDNSTSSTPAYTDSVESLIAPAPTTSLPFLGQQHAYSATLRGNGEAVIATRVIFTNQGETELGQMSLKLPEGVDISDLSAYQVIREEKPCIRYSAGSPLSSVYVPPVCEEYGPVDYYQVWGTNKYQKSTVENTDGKITISLPNPVSSGASGAFFLYFRTFDMTTRNMFGAYTFNFESLSGEENIQNITVGLSTDADQTLKGSMGRIDYKVMESSRSLSGIAADAPRTSATIDNYYSQIGYGEITKTVSDLASGETYKVEASYAGNAFQLYAKEVFIGLLVFLVVLVVVFIVGRIIVRAVSRQDGTGGTPGRNYMMMFGMSLSSAVLAGVYTGLLILVGKVFERLAIYDYNFTTFIWIMIAVVSFAVYALLILLPVVLMAVRRGLGWGIATFALTIVWLVGMVFIVFFVLFVTQGRPDFGPVMPLGRGYTKEMAAPSAAIDTPAIQPMTEPAVEPEVLESSE